MHIMVESGMLHSKQLGPTYADRFEVVTDSFTLSRGVWWKVSTENRGKLMRLVRLERDMGKRIEIKVAIDYMAELTYADI